MEASVRDPYDCSRMSLIPRMKRFFSILVAFLLPLLGGCGPNVVNVKALNEFPAPVVTAMPAHIGLHFTEEFRNFTHREERPDSIGGEWVISLGPTQVQVFRTIFSALFTEVTELPEIRTEDPSIQLIIVPNVEEFQFALPEDTKAQVFEIWIKYDLSIRDDAGEEIGRWPFTAYGKTPTAFLKSSEEAIHAAALVAMRDAGASIVSGVNRDPRLREWLGAPAGSVRVSAVAVKQR